MRKTKSFTIEGRSKTYEVKEMTPREWMQCLSADLLTGKSLPEIIATFQRDFLPKASNIKHNELLDMTPSEIDQCWTEFKEVNEVFFGFTSRLPIVNDLWHQVKPMVFGAFGNFAVDWLRRVMLGRPTMASGTSSTPSTSTSGSSSSSSPTQPTPREQPAQTSKTGKSSSGHAESKRAAG